MPRDDRSRTVLIALLLAALLPAAALARSDRAVVRVGPEAITEREVESALFRGEALGAPLTRAQAVEQLVQQALVGLYAREKGLAVGPEEVERYLEGLVAEGRADSVEGLLAGLEERGVPAAAFRAQVAANILAYKAARAALADRVTVTDTELENRYRQEHPPSLRLTLSHLFLALPEGAPEPEAAARTAEARELEGRIRSGSLPFAEAVATRSEDPSTASSGGGLGTFAPGELDPALEKAAQALRPGELSPPVRGPNGLHLLRLDRREEVPPPPLAAVREELAEAIRAEKGKRAQEEWLKELRARYLVEELPR